MDRFSAVTAAVVGGSGGGTGDVTGVKGNAESTYRKGKVNLTPANIGTYSSSEIDLKLSDKQDELTAGDNITIEEVSGQLVISATGGGGGGGEDVGLSVVDGKVCITYEE